MLITKAIPEKVVNSLVRLHSCSHQAITNLRENLFGEEIQNVMRETIDEEDENSFQVMLSFGCVYIKYSTHRCNTNTHPDKMVRRMP